MKSNWDSTGIASGKEIQVLALGFIIAGHAKHHELILKEKYLELKAKCYPSK
jgi:6,7-dimethyl-8-ribityllumazine synthase